MCLAKYESVCVCVDGGREGGRIGEKEIRCVYPSECVCVRERETESVREHKDNAYAYAKRERQRRK